jgi:molybdate transport system ATP-binding protein
VSTRVDIDASLERDGFHLDWKLQSDAKWLGLFGASGGGKTTALELALGWLRPTRGHVRLPRGAVGYGPQDLLLFPHWTVEANLLAPGRAGRTPKPGLLERVVEAFELGPLMTRGAGQLSGGEGRRVALARAILAASGGGLLVLDEPLSSLDRERKRRVLGLLIELKNEGLCTALIVSHSAADLQMLCDEVQVLETSGGRSSFGSAGPPVDVLADAGGFENILTGVLTSIHGDSGSCTVLTQHATAGDSGLEVTIPGRGLVTGDQVVIGLRADDVLVTLDHPGRVSARNVLGGKVVGVHPLSSYRTLEIRADGAASSAPCFRTHITKGALDDLGIGVGTPLFLMFKTRSVEVLAVTSQGAPFADGAP